MIDNKKDLVEELIYELSECLNTSIQNGLPYPQLLEALASLVAMALEIVNPLTDDKARLEKFRIMLKDSLHAQSAMQGKQVREIIA